MTLSRRGLLENALAVSTLVAGSSASGVKASVRRFARRRSRVNTIAPAFGIYTLAPGAGTISDLTSFYKTAGLDGVFVNIGWSDIETAEGVYNFSNVIDPILNEVTTYNSGLKLVLGIAAGQNRPEYLLSPLTQGQYAGYQIPNVPIFTDKGHQQTGFVTLPFPFDPAYGQKYLNMLKAVLNHLADPAFCSGIWIKNLVSLKIGLYGEIDCENTIPSFIPNPMPTQNPSEASVWMNAFTKAGYQPSAWQPTVTSGLTNHVQALTDFCSYLYYQEQIDKRNLTFSIALYSPKIGFPMIDANGGVDTIPNNDNSAFAFSLITAAAAQTNHPVQALDSVLTVMETSPPSLRYNLGFDQFVNSTGATGSPVLAFQTNSGGNGGTAGAGIGGAITLDPNTLGDVIYFQSLLVEGLSNPRNGNIYPYKPYIEIHPADVNKWNGSEKPFANIIAAARNSFTWT